MVFSSYIFVFYFLPIALVITYALYRAPQRTRNLALALMGYGFYGWAAPKFVFLMFATTLLDWLWSLIIARDSWRIGRIFSSSQPLEALAPKTPRSSTQRAAITISVVSNLALLGFFKYFNFAADSYNSVVAALGITRLQWDTGVEIALPLGISFYTFQTLSYIIDVYRGDAKAMRSFTDFACFVSMFPHLVAGPILKFSFLADQLEHRTMTTEKFARGVGFFCLGLAKKVILSNACAKIADAAFDSSSIHPADAWFGATAYAFQIYFDFSGYSDMAIGLGLMLGFVFARNFDHPYRSQSITEFWRRWHISLSTWLREYLYIPLGGNRKGKVRTYVNLFATMLLGGLWHGASWNYVIWGAIHGAALCVERSRAKSSTRFAMPKFVRVGTTFAVVLLAWIFFRAPDLPHAMEYLSSMIGLRPVGDSAVLLRGIFYQPYALFSFCLAAFVVWFCPDTWEWTYRLTWPKALVCLSLFCVSVVFLVTQAYQPFIYFIF
jgi:alginate O-acetyltransferase complex protein AlgI